MAEGRFHTCKASSQLSVAAGLRLFLSPARMLLDHCLLITQPGFTCLLLRQVAGLGHSTPTWRLLCRRQQTCQ